MKSLFVLVGSFFIILTSQAQHKSSFLAKWAPVSLAAGKITVGGEYNFKRKSSVELFIGIPSPKTYQFDFDGNESDLETKAFSILAGYRRYLGKNLSGFYVEPYVKYLHHQANGILEGDLNGEPARFATTTDYKGIGIGAQLGVQFLIAKRVSLDFFLLGPEANSAKTSIISTDIASNIPWSNVKANEAEQDLRDALEDLPIIGKKVEIAVNQSTKTVSAKYDGFLPGLRFGASIGFRF